MVEKEKRQREVRPEQRPADPHETKASGDDRQAARDRAARKPDKSRCDRGAGHAATARTKKGPTASRSALGRLRQHDVAKAEPSIPPEREKGKG